MSTRTITIDITGMHCGSCGVLVDDCMEDVPGVRRSQTSVKTGQCTAVVDDDVDTAALLAAVTEAGYVGTLVGNVPA